MKKIIIGSVIAVIVVVVAITMFVKLKPTPIQVDVLVKTEPVIEEPEEINAGAILSPRIINVVGRGRVASTTNERTQTMFQFPSSTDMTYWDTNIANFPHERGPTTTPSINVSGADEVLYTFHYESLTLDSQLYYDFSYSNDAGCGNASSTLDVANYTPLPSSSTTESLYSPTSNTFIPGIAGSYDWGVLVKDVAYNCLKLTASTNSTTDASYLYITAALGETQPN